jgi:hypothetical protein
MTHIQSTDFLINNQSSKNILISMTADVEVARDFFYGERSGQSAAILVSKGISGHLKLSHLIWLSQ